MKQENNLRPILILHKFYDIALIFFLIAFVLSHLNFFSHKPIIETKADKNIKQAIKVEEKIIYQDKEKIVEKVKTVKEIQTEYVTILKNNDEFNLSICQGLLDNCLSTSIEAFDLYDDIIERKDNVLNLTKKLKPIQFFVGVGLFGGLNVNGNFSIGVGVFIGIGRAL